MKARETEKKGKTMLKSKTQIVGSYEIRKFASRDYRIVDSQGQVIGSFTNKSHAKAFAVRNQQEHN